MALRWFWPVALGFRPERWEGSHWPAGGARRREPNSIAMNYPFKSRRTHWAAVAGGICLVALGAYHVICGEHGYLAYCRAKQQYHQLQQQTQQLRQQNQALQGLIDKLNADDPATIERQAREQLRMAKPNELVFTVPAPSTHSNANSGSGSQRQRPGVAPIRSPASRTSSRRLSRPA